MIKKGDTVSINGIEATVIEVLDPTESKRPKCWIIQTGKKYCVNISDLTTVKG